MAQKARIEIELATKGVTAVQRSLQSIVGSVQNFAGGLVAAFGFREVVQQMGQAVAAAQESAVAVAGLRTAAGEYTAALVEQADALQRLTGIEDEQVMAAQRALFSYGATAEQVRRLTPLAADLSAALGTDLMGAVRALKGALDGEKISLGKLNIEARDFDDLVNQLTQRVSGQAEAMFAARGASAELKVNLGELQETIGRKLLPTVNAAAKALNDMLNPRNTAASALQAQIDSIDSLASSMRSSQGANALATETRKLEEQRDRYEAAIKEWTDSVARNPAVAAAGLPAYVKMQMDALAKLNTLVAEAQSTEGFKRAQQNLDAATGANVRASILERAYGTVATAAQRASNAIGQANAKVTEFITGKATEAAEWNRRRQAMSEYYRSVEQLNAEQERREDERKRDRIATDWRLTDAQRFTALGGQGMYGPDPSSLSQQMTAAMVELQNQFGTVAQNIASGFRNIIGGAVQSVSDGITNVIIGTQTLNESLRQIGVSIMTTVINSIVQMGVRWVATQLLMAVAGKAILASAVAATAPIAAAQSAIWATPATLATIASYGSAAAAAPGFIASAQGVVLAQSVIGGAFADGGPVRGPGGPKSDSILARLSAGEYVLNAEAVRLYGQPMLDAMNRGTATVGREPAGAPAAASERALNLVLVDSRNQARQFLESADGEARILEIVRRNRMQIGIPT